MLKPMLASALFAGLIAGLFAAALGQAFLDPLISRAELYESGKLVHFAGSATAAHDHAAAAATEAGTKGGHAHGESTPGPGRIVLTVLTTIAAFCGFGLLLVAAFALAERQGLARIDRRTGLLFGLAGFAATQLMPGMGLALELPGTSVAALDARQAWWIATAVATAGGIALMTWGGVAGRIAGAVLIAAPQIYGAPHPLAYEGVVPPELAALFASRALAVGALGWIALGALAGHFWAHEAGST